MAVKKKGLGRGLDALFPEKSVKPAEKKPEQKPVATNESLHQQEEGSLNASAVKSAAETKDTAQAAVVEEPKKSEMLVKISKVEPNRTQPRKQFDEDALLELSESIKQFGILQPLLVSDKGDYYEIIAGERRWRAAKLAGLKEVPVIIKEFNDQQVVEISLIENIQREDLNPIEEAMAYKRLIDEFKLKQDNMNQKKISQEYEKAIQYIYELMKSGELTIGSRLPTERALAETLGIGRNSTREALSIMHGMGLIERRQGSGNYISENVGQSIKQTILMMIALKTITKREVCEFRRMMEKSVCNAVIHTGLTKEQRERLESMVNQMSMVTGENLVDTDKAFHEELIADTGNNLWITLMEAVVEVYREWIDYVIKHADGIKKKKLLKTHEMIYDSLIKKDIETLNAAIDEHYDIIEELLG